MKKQLTLGQFLPLLLLFQLLPLFNYAADFFPDPNVADGAPNSLRAVITIANSNNEADIIHLAAGVYGITLAGTGEDANATGDFDVFADGGNRLTIIGISPEASIIDGNNLDRVIDALGGTALTLENLTVRNGLADQGAGINIFTFRVEDLLIENCHIIDNKLTGFGFGGGVNFNTSFGTLRIYNSLIENNSAGNGSGLSHGFSNSLDNELVNVIFRNNTADFQAAINVQQAVLKIINCLVVDNQSLQTWPGGIYADFEGVDLAIINSTIANNSGPDDEFGQGISAGVKLTLQNTILSNPNNLNLGIFQDTDFTSNGGNVSSDNSTTFFFDGPNDLSNTEVEFNDPEDGDYTLAAGSPAINNGTFTSEVPEEDLQGRDRIIDGTIDSGAYEFRAFEELPLLSQRGILLLGFLMLSMSAFVVYRRML